MLLRVAPFFQPSPNHPGNQANSETGRHFFEINEAFHPPHYSTDRVLHISEDNIPNIEAGIDETSYPLRHYRRLFRQAGMKYEAINPRWDVRADGENLTVKFGANLYHNSGYQSLSVDARLYLKSIVGQAARCLDKTGAWRLLAHPKIFPWIRFQLLTWSTKEKISVARKPE